MNKSLERSNTYEPPAWQSVASALLLAVSITALIVSFLPMFTSLGYVFKYFTGVMLFTAVSFYHFVYKDKRFHTRSRRIHSSRRDLPEKTFYNPDRKLAAGFLATFFCVASFVLCMPLMECRNQELLTANNISIICLSAVSVLLGVISTRRMLNSRIVVDGTRFQKYGVFVTSSVLCEDVVRIEKTIRTDEYGRRTIECRLSTLNKTIAFHRAEKHSKELLEMIRLATGLSYASREL